MFKNVLLLLIPPKDVPIFLHFAFGETKWEHLERHFDDVLGHPAKLRTVLLPERQLDIWDPGKPALQNYWYPFFKACSWYFEKYHVLRVKSPNWRKWWPTGAPRFPSGSKMEDKMKQKAFKVKVSGKPCLPQSQMVPRGSQRPPGNPLGTDSGFGPIF